MTLRALPLLLALLLLPLLSLPAAAQGERADGAGPRSGLMCPLCGVTAPNGRFCEADGARLLEVPSEKTCPTCGDAYPLTTRFCPTDGAALAFPPETQRALESAREAALREMMAKHQKDFDREVESMQERGSGGKAGVIIVVLVGIAVLVMAVRAGFLPFLSLGGGGFLCDRCKYNSARYCNRPERPNARTCPDYKNIHA